jgi:hypothetical protein
VPDGLRVCLKESLLEAIDKPERFLTRHTRSRADSGGRPSPHMEGCGWNHVPPAGWDLAFFPAGA